jgi:hypothetical protein
VTRLDPDDVLFPPAVFTMAMASFRTYIRATLLKLEFTCPDCIEKNHKEQGHYTRFINEIAELKG